MNDIRPTFWFSCLLLSLLLAIESSAQEAQPPAALESRIGAYFQKIYNENLQSVYKQLHPWGGKASAITVTGAKITQWKDQVASGQGSGVLQFTIDYTILWSSILHPNGSGHTEARGTFDVRDDKIIPVGDIILRTNGTYTVDTLRPDLIKFGGLALKCGIF